MSVNFPISSQMFKDVMCPNIRMQPRESLSRRTRSAMEKLTAVLMENEEVSMLQP
jgi:hypothetical protein